MKYIIEIENEPFGRNDDPVIPHGMDELYRAKGFKSLVFDKNGLDKLIPYTEPDRKAIEDAQEKAWELASAIVCPSDCNVGSIQKHCKEIFGVDTWEIRGIFTNNTYQEAKTRYEAWKKQKDEIHVGDEIVGIYSDGEKTPPLVVLKVEDNYYYGIYSKTGEYTQGGLNYEKTGRHFDEVAELLRKMRGEEQ